MHDSALAVIVNDAPVNGVHERQQNAELPREPLSDIDVLIVGAGLGGLNAAVEVYRQGHNVRLIEAKSKMEGLVGDFVGIAPSATRHFSHWPGMAEKYRSMIYRPALSLYKTNGEKIGGPFSIKGVDPTTIPTPISRPKLISFLYDYVTSLGISITFGRRVREYYEILEAGKAGAVTEDGERFEADLVIAADGVATSSWAIVSGNEVKPRSSGFSSYRVAYPTKLLHRNPHVAKELALEDDGDDICRVYLGTNKHGIILASPETITWILQHKDHGTAAESWTRFLDAEDVLKTLEEEDDWDQTFVEVIKHTPPQSVVDYKILWRDPNTKWASDGGLILQLGDSAHSFLPTSANGATQAIEDGISIAACLKLAGKHSIPLATRVHTHLRFMRVSCAQRGGFKNREKWHHTDFDEAKKHPEKLIMQVGRWVNLHNPEKYVYENWTKCVNYLVGGTKFENTNIPPGYTYKPWTIDQLLHAAERESEIEDDGDWS